MSSASPYTRQTAPELQTWKLTTLANTTFRRIGPSEHAYGTGMGTGRVTDVETGEPLIFANVMVSGHTLGTQTDMNGDFSILLPQGASSLEVSYTGYTSQTVAITKQLMSIRLKSGMQLESVEIVGSRNRATDYYTDGVRLNSMSKATSQLPPTLRTTISQNVHPSTVITSNIVYPVPALFIADTSSPTYHIFHSPAPKYISHPINQFHQNNQTNPQSIHQSPPYHHTLHPLTPSHQ